jgi:hypothetical protein
VTRRALDQVRVAAPAELFVIADGPRPDRPDDVPRCAETRAVLDEVDWPCTVYRRFAEQNLGLEANVELGLDWVFGRADRAIVLEDDCLADPSFFRFAAELLERYRDDERIWYLTGNGLGLDPALFGDRSYAFSAWASVWGWATWAQRWQRHRQNFPRDHRPSPGDKRGDLPRRVTPVPAAPETLVTGSARRHFADAAASDDTVTHGWDKHWWLTIMTEGGLVITPAVSMVQNIGFGIAGATHTGGAGGGGDLYGIAQPMAFPLRHPDRVELDVEVERELELVLARVGSRAARLARQLIRPPLLRRLIRRLISSRPAMIAARTVSRSTERKIAK